MTKRSTPQRYYPAAWVLSRRLFTATGRETPGAMGDASITRISRMRKSTADKNDGVI